MKFKLYCTLLISIFGWVTFGALHFRFDIIDYRFMIVGIVGNILQLLIIFEDKYGGNNGESKRIN